MIPPSPGLRPGQCCRRPWTRSLPGTVRQLGPGGREGKRQGPWPCSASLGQAWRESPRCAPGTLSVGKAQTFNRWRHGWGLAQKETVGALTLQLGGHPLPKATGAETTGPAGTSCPLESPERTGEPRRQWHVIRGSHLPEIPPFPPCLLHAPWDSQWACGGGGQKGLNPADGRWLGHPRFGYIQDRNKITISAPGAGRPGNHSQERTENLGEGCA